MTSLGDGPASGPAPDAWRERAVGVLVWVAMAIAIGVVGLATEHTTVNGGLGWSDGGRYGDIVVQMPEVFRLKALNSYEGARFLPLFGAYHAMVAFHLPLTAENVTKTFRVINVVSLVIALGCWQRSAVRLQLSSGAARLGALLFFGSFFVVRNVTFYPVMMDTVAFGLGFVLLYAYVADNVVLLALTTLITAHVWPTGLMTGTLLLLWPRGSGAWERGILREPERARYASAIAAAAAVLWVGFATDYSHPDGYLANVYSIQCVQFPLRPWVPLSALILTAWLYGATRVLLLEFFALDLRSLVLPLRVIVVAAVWAANVVVDKWVPVMPNATKKGLMMDFYLHNLAFVSMSKPAISFVAHAITFGPIAVLAVLLFAPAMRVARTMGPGLLAASGLAVVMAVDSESRHLVQFIPLVGALVWKHLDGTPALRQIAVPGVLLAVANTEPWVSFAKPPARAASCVEWWRLQPFFDHWGPWMTPTAYGRYAVATAIATALLYALLRRAGYSVLLRPPPSRA